MLSAAIVANGIYQFIQEEKMKVILLKDVPDVGKIRQVVDVKEGYARNFLIKKKLALPANDENMKILEEQLAQIAANEAQIKADAQQIKDQIEGKEVLLKVKSGPEGRLYGAVTSQEIADALKRNEHVDIDKRKIVSDTIKNTGSYDIKIKLHPQVEALIKLIVETE